MSDPETLVAPTTYQGGKGRLANRIVAHIHPARYAAFVDLCCGSGAVSLAAVNAGCDPRAVSMVDLSPWGLFWQSIGAGTFDVDYFYRAVRKIPADPRDVKSYVEILYSNNIDPTRLVYHFLILQAAAIGGAAIWCEAGRWKRSSGFRDYWLPTATSSRRSPVNPMMPMPDTICSRVAAIAGRMRGVTGVCGDAAFALTRVKAKRTVVYIDPPYKHTTGHGYTVDALAIANATAYPCWVSEGRALSGGAVCLSSGEAKGGMTGGRARTAHEEWLSPFNLEAA